MLHRREVYRELCYDAFAHNWGDKLDCPTHIMKWLFNGFMLWGAVLGWLIVSSAVNIIDTARHNGSGVVHYSDGEHSPEWSEKVSESQYKRHNYLISGIMLSLGVFLWVTVARTARNQTAPRTHDHDAS